MRELAPRAREVYVTRAPTRLLVVQPACERVSTQFLGVGDLLPSRLKGEFGARRCTYSGRRRDPRQPQNGFLHIRTLCAIKHVSAVNM